MGNSYNTDKRGKFDKYRKVTWSKKYEYKVRSRDDSEEETKWYNGDRYSREIVFDGEESARFLN